MIHRTPLLSLEKNLYGKAENLQARGSYKIRGVINAIGKMAPDELKRGVCTVSAGNLGQALAFVANEMKIPCRIVVPETAPRIKKERILGFGAELVEMPFAQIWDLVISGVYGSEMTFLHPVFNSDLVDGYSSIGKEILEDLPDVDAVVIPYGLGGLFYGVAQHLKKHRPEVNVYAAEIEGASPLYYQLEVDTPHPATNSQLRGSVYTKPAYVDAIGTPAVVPQIFEKVKPLVSGSIVVSETQTHTALRDLYHQHGMPVEGAAAVSFAAARTLLSRNENARIACVLSGRNIDRDVLSSLL